MRKGKSNDVIRKLDEDIACYSRLATNARLERNSYMPVSQLPTEVLCRIFLFTREACMLTSRETDEGDMTWIGLSHVCHQWRRIALHEVRLWVEPPLKNTHWTTAMLERSKQARLTIKLDLNTASSHTYMQVFEHLPHIEKLSIHKTTSEYLGYVLNFLGDTPAPMLESLCICCLSSFLDRAPCKLPDNILLEMPNLRKLCLSNTYTDWESPFFSSSLTTLKLKYISLGSNPTLPQLWTLLERLPELEVLSLSWSGTLLGFQLRSDEVQMVPSRRHHLVPLKKLTKVELEGTQPHMQLLFDNIALPQDITSIDVTILHEDTSTLSRLITGMSDAFSKSFNPKTVVISRKSRQMPLSFDITATSPTQNSKTQRLKTSFCRFNVHGLQGGLGGFDTELDMGFTELFESFHWSNLSALELRQLDKGSLPSADTLADTFGSLPSVYRVGVAHSAASLFVEILQRGLGTASDDSASQSQTQTHTSSQTPIAFPGLKVIDMFSVEFDMTETDDEVEVDETLVNYQDFMQCLRNRRARGIPIREMQLYECESDLLDSRALKEVMLPSLQGVVDAVHWVFAALYINFEFTDSDEAPDDCL